MLKLLKSLLLLIGVLLLCILGYWLYHTRGLEPVVLSAREISNAERKLTPLLEQHPEQKNQVIVFSEREINGLINHHTSLGNTIQLQIEKDQITGHGYVKVPTQGGVMAGEEVRVKGEILVEFEQGEPYITIKNLSSFGTSIPEKYTKDFLYRNLYPDLKKAIGLEHHSYAIRKLEILDEEIRVTLF